ncbi:hypothetical protein [Streptomyces sp. NBC_01304]|uniref:hypothetical protein n=1 Tax=Streptomyces sp. NBC_01304 TaxID=2903818 RepID=UPI002E143509|nr:hypothetical protein OG430_44890 [Streptomyces sp. NBC_01304]
MSDDVTPHRPLSTMSALSSRLGMGEPKFRTAAAYYSHDIITSYSTTFTVPPAPTGKKDDAMLYLWPGLQTGAGWGVVQPVLGYGYSSNGWMLHTTAISNRFDNIEIKQGRQVNNILPGTVLTGTVTLTDKDPISDRYTYKVAFEGYPDDTSVSVVWPFAADEVMQAVEAWKFTSDDLYPPEPLLRMHSIKLVTESGVVDKIPWTTDEPERVKIVDGSGSNGTVDLYYRNI